MSAKERSVPQGKYARTGYTSPIDAALQVIGGKYKVAILYHLRASVIRFGELRRLMPFATARMLTKQLRELERDGMIRRKVFRQVPPRVDYILTKEGQGLVPILESLCEWGKRRIGRSSHQAPAEWMLVSFPIQQRREAFTSRYFGAEKTITARGREEILEALGRQRSEE